jgi:hypothetical protein
MTTSVVQYQRNAGGVNATVDREATVKVVEHRTPNTTNPQVVTVVGVYPVVAVRNVMIRNTSNVLRFPSGAVTFTAGSATTAPTVSITDAAHAATDIITFDVVSYI